MLVVYILLYFEVQIHIKYYYHNCLPYEYCCLELCLLMNKKYCWFVCNILYKSDVFWQPSSEMWTPWVIC